MATKHFNVKGICIPGKHYMVDMSARIRSITRDYIEHGDYFVINRPRQYGKTTMLRLLETALSDEYLVIRMSFESTTSYFSSLATFVTGFSLDIADILGRKAPGLEAIFSDTTGIELPDRFLKKKISELCAASDKPMILMVDEVDRASDYDVFAAFLGLLRDVYLGREEDAPTFQSVILVGVHDIKNLNKKIRPDSEHSYSRPWNIAADFTIDMSFSPDDIATMLADYEQDHVTGMDIMAVSDRLYFYTNGYPFLVSRLCQTIDEGAQELGWSPQGVDDAETRLLSDPSPIFDDLIKNIIQNPVLGKLLARILFDGIDIGFDRDNPDIQIGTMYGIFKDGITPISISSIVFETRITNYLLSISETREAAENNTQERSLFVKNGRLDMAAVVSRFSVFMKSEYRDRDSGFIEANARLLFLAFLKPIINGTGHYVVEPQTRGNRRMDVIVFYGHEEHIVELKIWHGEAYELDGALQLARYMESRGNTQGWLISFCDLKKAPREDGTFAKGGCTIHETIVAVHDKA